MLMTGAFAIAEKLSPNSMAAAGMGSDQESLPLSTSDVDSDCNYR